MRRVLGDLYVLSNSPHKKIKPRPLRDTDELKSLRIDCDIRTIYSLIVINSFKYCYDISIGTLVHNS